MGRLSIGLALAPLSFFFDDRHAGAVHLHIQNGNRRSDSDGQIQLHRTMNLLLLVDSNILSDGFGRALYRVGGPASTFLCSRP